MALLIRKETYLTVKESADEIGRASQTVYQFWKIWGWEAYQFGTNILFKKSQIQQWLDNQVQPKENM